jgi:prepilin-type processing-associated H-X9-DG protein
MALTQQGFWECHMLSSTLLLQNYLGGVDGRGVWQCPSSVNIYNAPIAGTGVSGFNGKVPGYGYMLNNSPNTALNNMSTLYQNAYYFGDWNAEPANPTLAQVVEWQPKRIGQIKAPVGPSQAVVGNVDILNNTVGLVPDASKTWLTCDLDGRNLGDDVSGTWCIVNNGNTGQTTTVKNANPYQPVHKSGSYYGRNYAFLDGHAEYVLMNDWPDACYQYP